MIHKLQFRYKILPHICTKYYFSFLSFMWNVQHFLNEKPIPNITHYLIACILYVLYIRSDNQVSLYLVARSLKERGLCVGVLSLHIGEGCVVMGKLGMDYSAQPSKSLEIFLLQQTMKTKKVSFFFTFVGSSFCLRFYFFNASRKMLYKYSYIKYIN